MKDFHFASVSVPIPSVQPGEERNVQYGQIPFGPPVIHANPEATLPRFQNPLASSPLYTDSNASFFYFNPAAQSVDVDMMEVYPFNNNDNDNEKEE